MSLHEIVFTKFSVLKIKICAKMQNFERGDSIQIWMRTFSRLPLS